MSTYVIDLFPTTKMEGDDNMGTKKNIRQEQNRTRTNQVKYRLTDDEYKMYLKKIEPSGMTQQEFFLHLINDSNIVIDNNMQSLPELLQAIYELLRQVKGIATNCNQMARMCNINREAPAEIQVKELADNCNAFIKEGCKLWESLKQLIHHPAHTQH